MQLEQPHITQNDRELANSFPEFRAMSEADQEAYLIFIHTFANLHLAQ